MITYEVNRAELKYIEDKLGKMKSKAPTVLSRALNKTATTARQKLANQTKKVYTYNKSVRGQLEIRRASSGNLMAKIDSTGKPHNATSFSHSASKKNGVKMAELRNGKKELYGSKGIRAWKSTKHGGERGCILQREGKERYPIEFKSGTSTPKMIENEKVYGKTDPEIRETLKKNIDNQIKFLLG